MRRIATADELFDILSSIKGGVKVTIGYVTGANLNIPKVKKVNPATNRMKGYHDYEALGQMLGQEGEVGGVIKLTSYSLNWSTPESFNKAYGRYKTGFDGIRQEFGLEPTKSKDSYTTVQQFGDKGVNVYSGNNDAIKDHSYTRQNIYGAKIKSIYYLIDVDGRIIKPMDKSELGELLSPYKPSVSGVGELRKMGGDDERVKEYIDRHATLKFQGQTFETSKILYIVATANGEPLLWVNERLQRSARDMEYALNDVIVMPADFMRVAKERYQKDLQIMNESNNMKLTMSDIEYIVEEATKRIVNSTIY